MEAVIKFCWLFSLFSVGYSSQKGVPAIIWSNDKASSFPGALTGHSISVQQFKDDYLPHAPSKHHMVLFMQDKLSMEDFTQHADVYNENTDGATFHNLKHIMESHPSGHVPSLSSSASLLDTMTSMAKKVHTLANPYNVKDLPLNKKQDGSHLIIVELPTTTGLHTREALRQIDGIVQSVHEQLVSLGSPFTAVYTAKSSSKPVGPNVLTYTGGRQLLAADEAANNASFWNVTDGCLYLYAKAVVFEIFTINADSKQPDNIKSYTLPIAGPDPDAASECGKNDSAILVVKYDNLPEPKEDEVELKSFEFTMDFSTSKGYWTLDKMTITYEAKYKDAEFKGQNEPIENKYTRTIYAPDNYSYHCSYQTPFIANTSAVDNYFVRVKTIELQAQYNGGPFSGPFGQVNDCVGFFTIPIWSALISMAVLIMIFFFGICMLTQVDTQDRFDDPKGKTIQVNVQE